MATKPKFTDVPILAIAQVSVANTNRDGSGTIATVATVGATGARVDRISAKATASTASGMLRLYLRAAAAEPWRLWREVGVVQTTASAGVEAWEGATDFPCGLALPPNAEIGASTQNAETFNLFVHGGAF